MKSIKISERYTKRESGSFKQYLVDIANIKMFTPDEEAACSLRAESGDESAIEELVRRNLRFVVSVAKQYEAPNAPLEDLVNEGNMGLVMAAQQYKVSTGFKFITYAVHWIRKMIMEYIAKNGRMIRIPSNKINGISKLNQHYNELEQKLGRDVDLSEVIDTFGPKLSNEEISELEAISSLRFESLDSAIDESDGGSTLYDIIEDTNAQSSDHIVADQDLKRRIKSAINTLKPRDQAVMIDLFGLDGGTPMTLKEVSDKIGLTREMVRQIREKSLKKLRAVYQ
jgi:RNA polymerase primary sigma factor